MENDDCTVQMLKMASQFCVSIRSELAAPSKLTKYINAQIKFTL